MNIRPHTFFLLSALLVACGDTDTATTADGGVAEDGGGDSEGGCPTTGAGSLKIDITGLPAGTNGKVVVTGPAGTQTVDASGTLEVGAGPYTLTHDHVASPDPFVRKAFAAAAAEACVRAGQRADVTIAYAQIGSSNKLWTNNRSGGTAPLFGFGSELLATSATISPTVSAKTKGSSNLTFDRDGNLWAAGDTTVDPPIVRYPASALGESGEKTHDIALNSALLDGGFPRVTALAFDADANLWASIGYAKKLVKYPPSQIATTGSPVPEVEIDGVQSATAIAFDADGNLWTSSNGRIVEYVKARLNASTADAPDVVIEVKTPPPVVGTLSNVQGLAFDASGNLWVNFDGVMVLLTPEDREGTGDKTITPAVQISLSVGALSHGIAFDEQGGLWFAYTSGKIARFAPGQLTSSGSKTPETILTSSDVAFAGNVVFYPAPAALPLFHRLP